MPAENTGPDGHIFADKRLLERAYRPGGEEIVDRSEEIAYLDDAITPMVFGQRPSDVRLVGPRGTGKTMCARHVAGRQVRYAREQGVAAVRATVDARDAGTETRTIRAIADRVNDPERTGVTVPERGLSTDAYYDRLWRICEASHDAVLVVLDGVDHVPDGVLARLSEGAPEGCRLGIVGIATTDRADGAATTGAAVLEREFTFEPYEPGQLRDILESRRDAFAAGALAQGVLARAVDVASRDHPDAKRAIDALRIAGELASAAGADRITPEFVDRAASGATALVVREDLRGATPHAEYVLLALASLAAGVDDPGAEFRTTRVHAAYESVCRERDASPRSLRRVRDLLRQHADRGLVARRKHRGGRADGNYAAHRLLVDPAIVREAVTRS